jgi:hypothetical protein
LAVDWVGSIGVTSPRRSWRQGEGTAGEVGEALFVGIARRQRDLDAGDQFGDAGGDLDKCEADRVELGTAPERGLGARPLSVWSSQ